MKKLLIFAAVAALAACVAVPSAVAQAPTLLGPNDLTVTDGATARFTVTTTPATAHANWWMRYSAGFASVKEWNTSSGSSYSFRATLADDGDQVGALVGVLVTIDGFAPFYAFQGSRFATLTVRPVVVAAAPAKPATRPKPGTGR